MYSPRLLRFDLLNNSASRSQLVAQLRAGPPYLGLPNASKNKGMAHVTLSQH